jgi:hypothetical protein
MEQSNYVVQGGLKMEENIREYLRGIARQGGLASLGVKKTGRSKASFQAAGRAGAAARWGGKQAAETSQIITKGGEDADGTHTDGHV